VSPRSEELIDSARARLTGARHALTAGDRDLAVSAAYYSMLYAARAALSEHDEHARPHGGTWSLFFQRFVASGAFDQGLHSLAQQAQEAREGADYEAKTPPAEEAERYVVGAGDFLAAVEHLLGDGEEQ
jgi:uncharacterized protein (UPF0332 family)